MPVFDSKDFDDHQQVVFCNDPVSGLKAIIAVHDTTRGPAVGGCRMWPYRSEAEALEDVLRLSRGMTYKSAISGLAMGGGNCVVIGEPRTDKSEALFRALDRPQRCFRVAAVLVEHNGLRLVTSKRQRSFAPALSKW